MPSWRRLGLIAGTGFTMIAPAAAHAQPRPGARAAAIRVAPAIYAFNGGIMDKGIIYILTGLAAFWLSVAGLVLLFI